MCPTITAFEESPDRGAGLARDVRVRWAFEEVGQAYDVRLVAFKATKEPEHLALHPFGQILTYEEGDPVLFESGAIVFHIAESHPGLLPDDPSARARAVTWMFAARRRRWHSRGHAGTKRRGTRDLRPDRHGRS